MVGHHLNNIDIAYAARKERAALVSRMIVKAPKITLWERFVALFN